MNQMFVKICGLTRPQDAELAASLGASAVGFVFWPASPRCVTTSAARAIGAAVPPHVKKIGVFVDEPLENVIRSIDEIGLDAVQLHGGESAEYCSQLLVKLKPETPYRLIKAVAVRSSVLAAPPDLDPDVLLLADVHDPRRRGGTGRTVNWNVARELAAARPTILAGGLNAGNITLAIRTVRPYGVDVSSGVESSPGIKDPNRLRSFFEALNV